MSSPIQIERTRVAYLFGSDLQSGIVRKAGGEVTNQGSTDLWRLRSDPADFVRLHIPGNFHRARVRPRIDNVATVLNLVTDPELNPRVLEAADRFLRGFPGRVINKPAAVLASGRDRISRLLAGIDGLIVPPVARFKGRPHLAQAAIERAGVTFPAILRLPGTHNGEVVALLSGPEELEARLDPAKTYLLTSFVDARGDEPVYNKLRLYWFGEAPLMRHRLVSDRWNVHGPDRERFMPSQPHWIDVERDLLARGMDGLPEPARSAMRAVRERMPLDFFGIDFALLPDGRALLFEANATMNFFPLSTNPLFDYTGVPIEAAARPLFDRLIAADGR